MKKKLKLFCYCISFLFATQLAAQVAQAEYYIDTDPGQGSGTAVTATDGNFDAIVESAFKNGIAAGTAGLHSLNIRVKDVNGVWGPVFKTVFYTQAALVTRTTSIAQAELFWDTDPGQGNGTSVLALDGNFSDAIEALLASGISAPALGNHTLNVRVKDPTGTWGPKFSTIVRVESQMVTRSISVSQAELFWDTDPGNGNGTPVLALDGNFDNAIETVLNSGLNAPTAGNHKLCVRVKDVAGVWGPKFTTVVRVDNALVTRSISVSQAELYWDTDPGNGNGTPLIALDGNFDQAIETALNSGLNAPASGNHKLCVRVKDVAGVWGPKFTTIVRVDSALITRNISVSQAELFWDTDPGNGNGTAMIAFDGNFDNAIEVVLNSGLATPSAGMHKLSVRNKDASGTWGPKFTTTVKIDSLAIIRNITVTAAEFYFDTDPGFGAGIQLLAFDGNFDDAIESAYRYWNFLPDTGWHTLNVRAKDISGTWGPVFTTALHLLPCTTAPVVAISPANSASVCPGDSILLSATAAFASYTWFEGNTQVATGQNYYASTNGFYKVYITDASGCPASSAFTQVTITPVTASITANGPTTFCQGNSVTLDAGSGFTSFLWSNGQTTQSIVVNSAGTYTVVVSSGSCSDTSAAITVTVNPAPPVPTISISGDTLFSSATTNIQWYLNGSPLVGATSPQYVPAQNGNYLVTVTDASGCSSSSAPYNYLSTGITLINSNSEITVFPNPMKEYTSFNFSPNLLNGDYELCIYNSLGQKIEATRIIRNNIVWQKQNYSAGIYLYEVSDKNSGKKFTGKIVVE